MTGPDWVAATAGDPLQPIMLLALRATMTPDSEAQNDQEADAFATMVDALSEEDGRRLAHAGAVLLSFTPRAAQAHAMAAAVDLGLPVVWHRSAGPTTRGAFGERR